MSRLYGDCAFVWEVLSSEELYSEEAFVYESLLSSGRSIPIESLVELGAGGGYLAQQFDNIPTVILVDRSEAMLALSRARNPNAIHLCADMCEVDFGQLVDAVLIHDAIMYLTDRAQIERCLKNAMRQLKPNGRILIVPDLLEETFFENIASGEAISPDGHIHLTEWRWKPDQANKSFNVTFSVLIRNADEISSFFETHQMGCLSYLEWCEIFQVLKLQLHELDLTSYELPRDLFLLSLTQDSAS